MIRTTAVAAPVSKRNIALELAQVQRERGYAMTREDFKRLGYTDEQLDDNEAEAGRLFAEMETREAA